MIAELINFICGSDGALLRLVYDNYVPIINELKMSKFRKIALFFSFIRCYV